MSLKADHGGYKRKQGVTIICSSVRKGRQEEGGLVGSIKSSETMLSVPSIMSLSDDKENHLVLSGGSVLTPTRTPLQPVNRTPGCATPLLLKRAQYSQVTPFGTPPVRTPRREKRLAPSALCLLSNSKSPSTRDVQLNSLVYKKVLEIISKKETEHENLLASKQQTITLLERQLQLISLSKNELQTDTQNGQGLSGKQDSGTSMSAPGTPVIHREQVDRSCSPYPTPTMILPLVSYHPIHQHVPSVKLLLADEPDEAGKVQRDTNSSSTHEVTNRDENKTSTTDDALSLPCKDSSDLMSAETRKEPSLLSTTVESVTTPLKTTNMSHKTSQYLSHDVAVCTSPIITVSQNTMVTPTRYANTSQMTTPVHTKDSSLSTMPVENVSVETMVTPVRVVSVGEMTSPVASESQETRMTPLPIKTDATVGTSPFCLAVPRPSEIHAGSMAVGDLTLHLETATISNALLRGELSYIKREKQLGFHQKNKKAHWDGAMQPAQLTQLSAERQVEELLLQQGQLLADLASLRSALHKRDETIGSLKANHVEHLAELNAELDSLRHDLVSAYQQKKNEIEALRRQHEENDYKPHYERVREEVTRLRAELNMYIELMDEMEESQQTMVEAATAVESMYGDMQQFLQLQRDERQKSQQQITKWKNEADSLGQENEQLKGRTEEAERKLLEAEELHASKVDKATFDKVTKETGDLKKALGAQAQMAAGLTQERDRYRRLSEYQRMCNSSLEKQVKELQEELTSVTSSSENLREDLREEVEFLHSERATQDAELLETKACLDEVRNQQTSSQTEDSLRNEITSLQEELDETKVHAHLKLLQQGDELSASLTAISALSERFRCLQSHLSKSRQHWIPALPQQSQKVSILPSITEGAQQRGTKQQRETRKSFVCSVLLAASGVQNELVTEDDSPQRSCSPVDVGQDAVREDACSLDEDGVVPESSELSLNEQIDRLTGVVDHSIESITLLAASITSTVSQLQEKLSHSENDCAGAKLAHESMTKECEHVQLQLGLAQTVEQQLQASLEDAREEIRALGSKSKMYADQQKIIAEKEKLIQTLKTFHSEALAQLQADGKLPLPNHKYISLQSEVIHLQETEQQHRAKINRCTNQIRKLNYNWQAAEAEVKVLAEVNEQVRKILCAHEQELLSWLEVDKIRSLSMLDQVDDTADLLAWQQGQGSNGAHSSA